MAEQKKPAADADTGDSTAAQSGVGKVKDDIRRILSESGAQTDPPPDDVDG